jgi:glycosyltransferase involved in cell wall biosynthesis
MISCILPVHNGERHIGEAIDSVLQQRRADLEIVVVDDGSTDATPSVVTQYGPGVRYHRQDRAGVATARNRGLQLANGDFISFIDHDDVWTSDKIALQLAAFERDPSLEFVTGMVEHFGMDVRGSRFERPVPGYVLGATLARRSLYERVGPYAVMPHISECDWLLRMRSLGTREMCLPQTVYRRRLRPDSLSHSNAHSSVEQHLRLVKRHLDQKRSQAR